jgi:hypothetical protein
MGADFPSRTWRAGASTVVITGSTGADTDHRGGGTLVHGVSVAPGGSVSVRDDATVKDLVTAPAASSAHVTFPKPIIIETNLTVVITGGADSTIYYGYE